MEFGTLFVIFASLQVAVASTPDTMPVPPAVEQSIDRWLAESIEQSRHIENIAVLVRHPMPGVFDELYAQDLIRTKNIAAEKRRLAGLYWRLPVPADRASATGAMESLANLVGGSVRGMEATARLGGTLHVDLHRKIDRIGRRALDAYVTAILQSHSSGPLSQKEAMKVFWSRLEGGYALKPSWLQRLRGTDWLKEKIRGAVTRPLCELLLRK